MEEAVKGHRRTKRILERFSNATVIEIAHYKDVFCRKGQDAIRQGNSQKLVLAAKRGTLIYPGAAVCHDFGNKHFYYTSCMMNCVFDCEYCYLKGMYPSGNIVVFVNLEEIFAEVERMLNMHPLYLCISYDTDLLALEKILGYVRQWCLFAEKHKDLKIEIRTKCVSQTYFKNVRPVSNVIYAFTLSPQAVIEAYEHYTPSLQRRIFCIKEVIRAGCLVRLCFDPMIYLPEWEKHYGDMLTQVCTSIDWNKIIDVSIGSFRISQDYLKKMRKQEPDSAVVWFPFQRGDGYYHYPDVLMEEMERFLVTKLESKISKEKIFRWRE